MGAPVRKLLIFDSDGSRLSATLDGGSGPVGLLFVTGGTQTRIGSHRMYERLAMSLAGLGYPCFRFDRRGVGDSEGEDLGFRDSGEDLRAAAAAFKAQAPQLERVIGFGLCDGATALMLFGGAAELAGMILVNPWLVEAQSGAPPPAAIRRRYIERLTSRDGWARLFTGRVSFSKLAVGLRKAAAPTRSDLGEEALAASRLPARLILARRDATAIAAEQVWRRAGREPARYVDTDSHTFARSGDLEALSAAVLEAIGDLSRE